MLWSTLGGLPPPTSPRAFKHLAVGVNCSPFVVGPAAEGSALSCCCCGVPADRGDDEVEDGGEVEEATAATVGGESPDRGDSGGIGASADVL